MLIGKNVRIRSLEKADLPQFYDWMSNQESLGSFMDAHLVNKESFIEGMEVLLKDKSKLYTIIEDCNGKPIGIMNYREVLGSSSTVEIGVLIGESTARGKGLGKECLELFSDYIFNTKNIMRIQYITRVENTGMKLIGEKIGFVLEGVLRKYKMEQGEYRDYCMMAMTREEWNLNKTDMA